MATISKRKDTLETTWQAIIRRRGYPQQSKTFPTRGEAEAWAGQIEADMRRGAYQSTTDAERTTLEDLIKRFKTEYAPFHYRKRDDEKEAWRFQCARLDEALGAYALVAIDQKLIAAYRDGRLKGSADRRGVGDSSVRKELYMLSKLLDFALGECGIALPRGNPVDRIRKPAEGRGRERRLTSEEWGKLETEIRASRNPWISSAFAFAVETAMRQGELLSLTWQQIDRQRRLALLTDSEKIKNAEPRAVPLSTKALAALDSLPRALHGPIFKVERMTLYHAFLYACRRAGIKDYTWHDLRHEALSRLAERGDFSVLELAAVSGHKTLQMLKRYTHLQAEALARKLG